MVKFWALGGPISWYTNSWWTWSMYHQMICPYATLGFCLCLSFIQANDLVLLGQLSAFPPLCPCSFLTMVMSSPLASSVIPLTGYFPFWGNSAVHNYSIQVRLLNSYYSFPLFLIEHFMYMHIILQLFFFQSCLKAFGKIVNFFWKSHRTNMSWKNKRTSRENIS